MISNKGRVAASRSLPMTLAAGCAFVAAVFSAFADPLLDNFRDPPASARPLVWWHWMNGNITQEGVDLDLDWMKRIGIAGFQNFDATFMTPQVVDKRLVYMSPEWQAVFRHSAERAEQLGLEMGIASSPGWSESGGPWVKPEQAMKKLVWSETPVEGGHRFKGVLKAPPTVTGPFQYIPEAPDVLSPVSKPKPTYYADAAVIAYPVPEFADVPQPVITSSAGPIDGAALLNGAMPSKVQLKGQNGAAIWTQLDYGANQTMRSATISAGAPGLFDYHRFNVRLEASDDGAGFRPISEFAIAAVAQQTVSFPATTARYFRFELTQGDEGPPSFVLAAAPGAELGPVAALLPSSQGWSVNLSELLVSPKEQVHQFELKAGFGVASDYYVLESPGRSSQSAVAAADVLDLSGRMNADGRLDWTPPKGHWVVLRLGYSLLGAENHPATPEATGLEVDKLNAAYVKSYIDTYLGKYAAMLGPDLMGAHGLRAMTNDSTEVGPQNWTDNILGEFQRRRGYDPRPWLPTLTGVVVGSGVNSDAFLYDFRKTLAEMTAEYHYKVIAEEAHARGLLTYGEALEYHRPSLGDDIEMRRYTSVPMAAMWSYNPAKGPNPDYFADIRGAASVAHLYGHNLVAAESMTSSLSPWAFAPRDLKRVIDLEFALGVNRPVVHTSVHQPLVDKKPGLSLFIFGQYFNRNDTWAEQAKPWVDYIARNAFMLQQGRFFADVAYFEGEEAPLTALYGDHDTADRPHGYAFDFVNPEILNHLLRVENGSLVAPSGARYRLLYLGGSSSHMTLSTLQKIHDLVEAGAVVAGQRPTSSPGLLDDALAFKQLADSLWTSGEAVKAVGRGKVIAVSSPDDALALLKLAKDFDDGSSEPDADVMFVHRKLPDGDLYYVDNRKDRTEHLQAQFRVNGRAPELWRAESGVSVPTSYRIGGDVTTVPLSLSPEEAVYVVFRKPAGSGAATIVPPAEKALITLDGPWEVSFEPGRGAPATVRFDQLSSWTESANSGVKYFSGAATYAHELLIKKKQLKTGRLLLDLGDVRDLAEVRVNGILVGTPWHAPYRADLTDALKAGGNHLEIKVVNTWVNRLIGDKQPGATRITFTAAPTYQPDAPLRPSGLLGPVQVLSVTPAP